MSAAILVVEDDKELQHYLRELLVEDGYSVTVASDGVAALDMLEKISPDLLLLDLGLPKVTGESVCRSVKKKFPTLPIIILTAKDNVSDIVQGLQLGADDYITKPFVTEEFLARVHARLRRVDGIETKLQVDDLSLDPLTHVVKRGSKQINLTAQEYKMLHYLMLNKGRVLTRDMILNRIWMYSPEIETRVVDVYIGYLRKKIDAGYKKQLIQSVRGFGYVVRE